MPETTPESSGKPVAEVHVAEDKMAAFLTVHAPGGEESVSEEELLNVIREAGVSFGLDRGAVQKIMNEKQWDACVEVATGKEAIPGADARLEFSFPTEASLKPKKHQDGSVDYKEVGLVHSIEKDAALVRKIEAKRGEPGMNVLGEELPAVPGKDVNILAGAGAYPDEKDEAIIRAAEDGVVHYDARSDTIEVLQLYLVPGSVDFSTGNLNTRSSIEVRGDVKPGFSITTPYDVEVKGVVEHASISCSGALKVHEGIIGEEGSEINVRGDVHAGYIHNQMLACAGSVYTVNEIRHCNIECKDEVVVVRDNGLILGGTTKAINQITAAFIGSENSVPTVVEVGIDTTYLEALGKKQSEKQVVSDEMEKIRAKATKIIQTSRLGNQDFRFVRLKPEWERCKERLAALEAEVAELAALVYGAPAPEIQVKRTIYPGVTLRIKQASHKINNELTAVKFRLVAGKVEYAEL